MNIKPKAFFSRLIWKKEESVSSKLSRLNESEKKAEIENTSFSNSNAIDSDNFPTAPCSARFRAAILDHFILFVIVIVPVILLVVAGAFLLKSGLDFPFAPFVVMCFAVVNFILQLSVPAAPIVYYAWFESSKYQATPGKRIVGLKVVDSRTMDKVGVGKAIWKSIVQYVLLIVILIVSTLFVRVIYEPSFEIFSLNYNLWYCIVLCVEAVIAGLLFCLPLFSNKRFTILDKITGRTVVNATDS